MRDAIIVSVLFTLRWCMVEKGKGWPGTPKVRVLELVPLFMSCATSLSIRMSVCFNLSNEVNNNSSTHLESNYET